MGNASTSSKWIITILSVLVIYMYWYINKVDKKYYPIEVGIGGNGNQQVMEVDSIVEQKVCDCHTSDSTEIKFAYKDGLSVELTNILYVRFK